jgi:hypothetical protein
MQIPKTIKENPRSFIQIPQSDEVIAIEQTHNGKDTYQQLESLAEEKMKLPYVHSFMIHRQNAFKASKGESPLFYADGTEVSKDISKDLWKRFSSGHQGGCWTGLDAYFTQEGDNWNSTWYIQTDLRVKKTHQSEKSLEGNKQPLDTTTLHEDCYAELKFNPQGLPIIKSINQKYKPEENIYFAYPRDKSVVWLGAGSGWADLGACRYPRNEYPALGVYASAKGASQIAKILSAKK